MVVRFLVILLLPILSCAAHAEETLYSSTELEVSFFQIIANPDEYEGREIIVMGFALLNAERPSLYPTRDSYEYFDYPSGIYLLGVRDIDQRHCELRFCFVTGIFSRTLNEKRGIFFGYLSVTDLEVALSSEDRERLVPLPPE